MRLRFDIMGIIIMVVAIVVGNLIGSWIGSAVGMAGGLIGAFIVGLCVYAIYCLLTGQKMNLMNGAIFAIMVYVSGLITTWIGSATGLTGGILGLLINALVLSIAWGYVKGKGIATSRTRKKRRR